MFSQENLEKTRFGTFIYRNRYFLMSFTFVAFFCIIPILFLPVIMGDDYTFHLQRIAALAEEIDMGNFRPRIYSTIFNGSGYASPLFYGDLFLLIPAMLVSFCNISVLASWKIFNIILILSATVSMFLCTRYITKNDRGAFLGTILFVLSSYAGIVIFRRSAIGELQSFIFFPVAFTGLYDILHNNCKKWYLLPLGLALVTYSHTLSAVISVFALFLFMLLSLGKITKEPSKLKFLFLGAGIFFILTADFIFPMIEQMKSTEFLATSGNSTSVFGDIGNNAFPVWAIFCDVNQFLLKDNWLPNGLGYVFIFIIIYFIKIKNTRNKLVEKFLVVSVIFLLLTTKIVPWNTLPNSLTIIQFPWRLLFFGSFFAAVAAGIYFKFPKTKAEKVIICISLISFLIVNISPWKNFINGTSVHGKTLKSYINHIGTGEYLPNDENLEKTSGNPIKYYLDYIDVLNLNADTIFTDKNVETSFKRENGKLIVNFENNSQDNTYLDVPILMYKGYTATLENGKKLECKYGKYNRIRVDIENRKSGTVIFEYTGTPIQKVSRIVSISGVIGMIVYFIITHIRKKRQIS